MQKAPAREWSVVEESSDSLERRGVTVTHLAREVKSSNLSHATNYNNETKKL